MSKNYKTAYGAALGDMLVQYNELEIKLGFVLQMLLKQLDVPHLYKVDDKMMQKLDKLEIAMKSVNWPAIDFDRVRKVHRRRNDLAHGHLEQDPNTGEFITSPVHKSKGGSHTTVDEIQAAVTEVIDALADVSSLLPHAWFAEEEDVFSKAIEQLKASKPPSAAG